MNNENQIHVHYQPNNIHPKQLKIMVFLMNALEKGWCIKKKNEQFIFTKKHEGKKEVFDENYLDQFIQSNFDMDILEHTK
jgi:hypothetical protein|tara:strand:+ start:188 stop:427 length:240 start_codon:yes stop_codon:yes gene_type:complete